MTYFGFLAIFLGIPILILGLITWADIRRGRPIPPYLSAWNPWAAIALHAVLAVVYTTPWDNYLVATGVWYYDPGLVTGIVLGWVPIEEYTFFVVQSILAGLWILFLARRLKPPAAPMRPQAGWRWGPAALLGFIWLVSVAILAARWRPGTYLGLELAWALAPIMLQLAFGGDILRHYGRLVLSSLIPMVVYLSAADKLAIGSGTWMIDPQQSLNIFIWGLPLEELIFFLLTNTLITLGIILVLSVEGGERLGEIRRRLRR